MKAFDIFISVYYVIIKCDFVSELMIFNSVPNMVHLVPWGCQARVLGVMSPL